jgi:hypothetical protein
MVGAEWVPSATGKPAIDPAINNIAIWKLQGASQSDIRGALTGPGSGLDAVLEAGWQLGQKAEQP